jgi:hypothetical protein
MSGCMHDAHKAASRWLDVGSLAHHGKHDINRGLIDL